jgi:hypothetical protein
MLAMSKMDEHFKSTAESLFIIPNPSDKPLQVRIKAHRRAF